MVPGAGGVAGSRAARPPFGGQAALVWRAFRGEPTADSPDRKPAECCPPGGSGAPQAWLADAAPLLGGPDVVDRRMAFDLLLTHLEPVGRGLDEGEQRLAPVRARVKRRVRLYDVVSDV